MRTYHTRGPALTAIFLCTVFANYANGQSPGRSTEAGCTVCHGVEGQRFELDVHVGSDIGCTTCHGGTDGTNDQARAHGDNLRTLKDPRAAVESCSECHADPERMRGYGLSTEQLALYWTSAHGQALAENGDADVATCIDCHGSHGVLPSTDPRSPIHKLAQVETCGSCHADVDLMERYGLDAGVVDEFVRSVHGVALLEENILSSPSCTDCHGSHGAKPPRVADLGRVCGECHAVVQDYFAESPHAAPAREGAIDECISCHDNHLILKPTSAMFVGKGPGHCATCHVSADDRGAQVAAELHTAFASMDGSLSEAEVRVQDAASRGLFLSEEHSHLDDAHELRARSRSVAHALSPGRLDDLTNRVEGLIDQTYQSVATRERALRDRKIFTAIFLGVALFLAGVLYAYRRESFGSWRTSRRSTTASKPEVLEDPA